MFARRIGAASLFACALIAANLALAAPVFVDAPKAPSFAPVVEAVSPAVVSVRARSADVPSGSAANGGGAGPIESFFNSLDDGRQGDVRPVSQGSGFFVSPDGYVVTNDDVVAGGDSFDVVLADGRTLSAKLVGEDRRTDLAVLKVEAKDRTFTYLGFADDDKPRIGDWVVAVGNPYGLGVTVTAGIVSSRGSDLGADPYDDYLQFDALVKRGDAGGPAFNLSGQVVGVNAMAFSAAGGNMGVAFAIPAATVKKVVHELIENGTVERGWLGVTLQNVDAEIAESVGLDTPHGALVADVDPKSPAHEAGLKPGDVVTRFDGTPVENPRSLAHALTADHPGTSVSLDIWRNGNARTLKVTLAKHPNPAPPRVRRPAQAGSVPASGSPLAEFGLTVVASDARVGVVVTDVVPGSPADDRGLEPGDAIRSIGGLPVHSAQDVLAALSAAAEKGRKAVLFRLEDGGRSRFIALPVEKG
ncbi:PDZ domain-containing protein [Pararhizobium mangrovi]|uniref:Probable periplasmic serine endoprotease DegP-like n=1 Tax=Pararhizobium mangrovi TaxID=2590452 RepID=A0A506UHI4_9HYPH|nr:PDZ domain-containing protein [Pararhizobium mangrovi]TPW32776.1 PDZ domain-containing protein [Pararhizobium mangrovi]